MQKHVNLVDLVKSFPTNIYLQNLASIQKRTSPVKFAHLAEKSEKCSISNLSTKAPTPAAGNVEMNLGPDLNSTALCSDVSVGQYCGVFLEKAYKCNIRDPDSNLSFFRSMDLF